MSSEYNDSDFCVASTRATPMQRKSIQIIDPHDDSTNRKELHMLKTKLRAIAIGAAMVVMSATTSVAHAGIWTGPVTAMGFFRCGPVDWTQVWIKFAGFYWIIADGVDFSGNTPASYGRFVSHLSNIAQLSMASGASVTGGCQTGSGLSNCGNFTMCDGKVYWYLDSLQIGN